MEDKKKLDYAAAGVDIDAGDRAVERIKSLAKATFSDAVLSEIGSFGGFYKPDLGGIKKPVLISSADGVGTKLKIAFMTGRHTTVGTDLVNHCTDDILVHGARPLFFLDYIGTGKISPDIVADIVEGFSSGCKANGMALLGGETAEMPGFYADGEYDLAGFIVGLVDQDRVVSGRDIAAGDTVIGLASDGLHTNGYSLARKVFFERAGLAPDDFVDSLGRTAGDELLRVHRSYLGPIMTILDKFEIKGMAHITGGGLPGNLVRILPENCRAEIDRKSWPVPPVFRFIQEKGPVDENEMYRAFNMGIGYTLVVAAAFADKVADTLKSEGETPYILGTVTGGTKAVIIKD